MSQWNPRRSRGASLLFLFNNSSPLSLSGTPAEAGVRDIPEDELKKTGDVSVEPPPKQGCEIRNFLKDLIGGVVSVEPPPKQGCEDSSF